MLPEVWVYMAKIGILINSNNIKDRNNDKNFFDGKAYYGFRYIISEIDKKHIVEYCSNININNYDFILYSITSWYDYLNLINILKDIEIKTKIIIGGAGFLNVYPLYDYIWAGVFGRGEGIINKIFNKEKLDNVWYKEDDLLLENKYKIGKLKEFINIEPAKYLKDKNKGNNYGSLNEVSFGCKKRCFFCQYSWKHDYTSKNNQYTSGYAINEDFFLNLDWSVECRYKVSAFDGMSEKTRFIINKPLKDKDIINKFKERNLIKNNKSIQLKLYNIYGYPFEKTNDLYLEFDNLIREVDNILEEKICILLNNTHFVPMPMTPMEGESVNLDNLKEINYSFEGKNIKVIKPNTGTSYISSAEQTVINRCNITNYKNIKILLMSKYQSLYPFEKIKVIKKYFGNILEKQKDGNIIKYIDYNIDKYKQEYYKRKEQYYE